MSYNRKEVTWDVGTDGKVAMSDDTWRYVYKALDLHQNVGYIGGGHDADGRQFLMLVSLNHNEGKGTARIVTPETLAEFLTQEGVTPADIPAYYQRERITLDDV